MMTVERFNFRTEQWSNSLQRINKLTMEIKQLQDTITCMRLEKEQLVLQATGLEMMLRKFEQPRPFVVFSDEMKRATIEENHRLVDEVERLEKENSGLKDDVGVLRQRWKRRRRDGSDVDETSSLQ